MHQNRISAFLKKGSVKSKTEQFEDLSAQVNTKEELRELEASLLTPDPIPLYVGEGKRYLMNSEHTVKFVFKDKAEMEFFGRFIPIAEYKEKSVTNIQIILDLFRAIDNGEIFYDKKSGNFQFNSQDKRESESSQPQSEAISGKEENIEHPTRRKLFRKRNS